MSTFNICKINSMNFPNPKNPALFAGCDTCPKRNGIRPWNRYNGETCLKNFTLDELDMRRKAEILQYKNNDSNMSSKQLNARLFRGIGTQKNHGVINVLYHSNQTYLLKNLLQITIQIY